MEKIVLFGGSFDPIHNGHEEMVLRLTENMDVQKVLLMPTFVPPHKIRSDMASAQDRLAMCRLVADKHGWTVSDEEIKRGGASFTVDTLQSLHEQYPEARLILLVGADMFCTLRTWYRYETLISSATVVTVPREGTPMAEWNAYAERLREDGADCVLIPTPVQTVSSTEIRRRISDGQPLTGLVCKEVEDYILTHGLYVDKENGDTAEKAYRAILKTRLGEYRYHHSLCVSEEAVRLAKKYGADEEKARTAGLLHDIMKDTPADAQLKILRDFGILLDDVERVVTKLWHAKSGAVFLQHILNLDDEEILQAVRYHTTGRAGMTLLEKVLFVADFTAADRTYDDVDEMRRLCDLSLEDAMIYGIVYTIQDLMANGQPVHPDTLAAYNDLILHHKEE